MNNRSIKVLLAKVGLDNQDKEIKLIARGLKEYGKIEVYYSGLYCSLEEIVDTALKENVDLVGVSVRNSSHNELFPRLRELLDEKKAGNVMIFGEGWVPDNHKQSLKSLGAVDEIFEPRTSIKVIVDWINKKVAERKN